MIRVEGHFGELLQGRLGREGPVVLVSLPCPALAVEIAPAPCHDPHGLLPQGRARALLDRLGLPDPGAYALSASMPRGGGGGASTAALVALARLAEAHAGAVPAPPPELARACVAVEGASDPLMFPQAERLLWASRRAEIVTHLPPLPVFDVVGGFFGPNLRTDPSDDRFPDLSDLIPAWTAAAASGDIAALAALAGVSAERTLALRATGADPTAALAEDLGALGHVIAHTGSARGLLFAQGTIPADARSRLQAAGFRRVIAFTAGGGE